MKEKELTEPRGGRKFLLVFDVGEEVVRALREWADSRAMTASFSGIGAFRSVALGYFEIEAREYVRIPIDDQVEVLSLSGNVALADHKPIVHAHVVVGKRDGTAHGGHLLEGVVRPTLELIVVESAASMRRTLDPATGLPLLDPRS